MKQTLHPIVAKLLLLSFFIFPACQKEHCPQDNPNDVKFCPILALNSIDPLHPSVIQSQYSMHYNTAGDPVDMLTIRSTSTGQTMSGSLYSPISVPTILRAP